MKNMLYKHMDVDVISFLQDLMKKNTQHYQSDFEIDKRSIKTAAYSNRKEDKTLLWLARPMGTYCHTEYETFIRDTSAHNSWRYYAEHSTDPIVACAVELTGFLDGVIRGNVYELDYRAHAAEIAQKAVQPLAVEKTFRDNFIDRVEMGRGSYGYYVGLVEKHGPIISSKTIPQNEDELLGVLREQKRLRDNMKAPRQQTEKKPLDEQIAGAESKTQQAAGQSGRTNQQEPDGR